MVGAGSWGTALARLLAKRVIDVALWAREPEVVAEIRDTGENRTFLPGVQLPGSLTASSDLAEVVAGKGMLISVVPSQFVSRNSSGSCGRSCRRTPRSSAPPRESRSPRADEWTRFSPSS